MKSIYLVAFLLFFGSPFASAQSETNLSSLVGEWSIDLRPSPDAEPYIQSFVISEISDKRLMGSFYGSVIETSKLNSNWSKLYFAFTTSDSSHKYYHSGYFKDGKVYGVTYCPGRDFTQPWNGKKVK